MTTPDSKSKAGQRVDPTFGLGPPKPAAPTPAAAIRYLRVIGAGLGLLLLVDAVERWLPAEYAFYPVGPGREFAISPGRPLKPNTHFIGKECGALPRIGGAPNWATECPQIEVQSDADGYRNLGVALDGADIAVIGDSFAAGSGNTDAAAPWAQLGAITGKSVVNRSIDGAAFLDPIDRFREIEPSLTDPPQTVVWIMVDRKIAANRQKDSALSEARTRLNALIERSPLKIVSKFGISMLLDLAVPERRLDPPVIYTRLGERRMYFYQPDIDASVHVDEPRVVVAANSIREIGDDLKARGIRLVAVVVPAKWTVYGPLVTDLVPPVKESTPAAVHTGEILERELAGSSVTVVDLGPAMVAEAARREQSGEPALFWLEDTHWSPDGIRFAMEMAAEAL